MNVQQNGVENILQYFPYVLLNQLLQVSGIESRLGAILIASIDPQIPMLRTEFDNLFSN